MVKDNFAIKIFTPDGLLVEERITSVLLPGKDGEMGVLPDHIQYVGLLGTGILEYVIHPSHEVRRMIISEGICSFEKDQFIVMSNLVAKPENIDVNNYADEREDLINLINQGRSDDPEIIAANKKLEYIKTVERLIGQ